MEKRKGARSKKDIPEEIISQLNQGLTETVNLMEWLSVDQSLLLRNILDQYQRTQYLSVVLNDVSLLAKPTINKITQTIGVVLWQESNKNNDDFIEKLKNHPSDVVRCWAAFGITDNNDLILEEKFYNIKPFAADSHFGVREIAWLTIREQIADNLEESITILSEWALEKDQNLRRFASEATRPRGVWCKHIEKLKSNPELGLPILEPLKSDPSKYVRDSVGNWLNDASKSNANFVSLICDRWVEESPTSETLYIVKKALRTLRP